MNIAATVSIHALLAESDSPHQRPEIRGVGFLSTLSLRRATTTLEAFGALVGSFYPRSPCGERLQLAAHANAGRVVSIHALLAESDRDSGQDDRKARRFLSTLSLRRATDYQRKRPA